MTFVDLELFKKHVNVDFDDDDTYLGHLLEAAESKIIQSTNRSAAELCDMRGGEFPAELLHAVLLLAGYWYNQREGAAATAITAVPYAIDALVKPFTRLA